MQVSRPRELGHDARPAARDANLAALLDDLADPPIDSVGALTVDAFLPKAERQKLASALNNLLASPTFAAWRTGRTLDVGAWLTPSNEGTGKTPAVIVSVAHLDDAERSLVLGVIVEEVLAWTRQLPGTSRLRALVVFDEVYGYLPPHTHNPPTKRPLVALLKQARAFGVGVVVATQNPMDLDYRALGNAGVWAIGRLQTDADRERVVDGLGMSAGRGPKSAQHPDTVLQKLPPRWFLVRNVHEKGDGISLLHPRWAMSFLRGPMTRGELQRALRDRRGLPGGPGGETGLFPRDACRPFRRPQLAKASCKKRPSAGRTKPLKRLSASAPRLSHEPLQRLRSARSRELLAACFSQLPSRRASTPRV